MIVQIKSGFDTETTGKRCFRKLYSYLYFQYNYIFTQLIPYLNMMHMKDMVSVMTVVEFLIESGDIQQILDFQCKSSKKFLIPQKPFHLRPYKNYEFKN